LLQVFDLSAALWRWLLAHGSLIGLTAALLSGPTLEERDQPIAVLM
jgi:hypothetical protein